MHPTLLAALLLAALLARPSAPDPEPLEHLVSMPDVGNELLAELVRASPATWGPRLASAHDEVRRDPEAAIKYLVEQLTVDESVPGLPLESQIYSVCGNALTLLERLTDAHICGCGGDWIGFATHDHRSASPDAQTIQYPWEAWLHARSSTPVEQWFWGLSYPELRVLSDSMRRPESEWSPELIAEVQALGSRAYPYLLDKLLDQQVATHDLLFCAQAHRMLGRITGLDFGPLPQVALLHLEARDPEREQRTVIHKNKSARDLMHQRWSVALLQR